MKQRFALLLFVMAMLNMPAFSQQNHTLLVKAAQPTVAIQPTMWGIFFEDINLGADGGIYAELVKNRSFEFFKPMMGWAVNRKKFVEGEMLVINRGNEDTRNPRFLRVTMNNAAKGDLGLTNEGFRGMGIKKGLRYDFSIMYRQPDAHTKLHLELIDTTKQVVGDTVLSLTEAGDSWHKAAVSFHARETVLKGKLNIWFEGNGTVDVDMISLFPGDTWKNRPGGMRADMVQWLAEMKPGFIRFPGGCIVEGFDLTNRYRWKNTVGPIEERQLMINRWNIEFPYRNAPDYFQTFGLGFFEYFQLAEDIGAEALPILNCGMACQFNSAEVVPMQAIDPYVQDALDLIEFANGDVSTKWGKVRANMGHPAPFNLKMMGVGNENWGPQYIERLKVFQAAIKAKYPNFKLICSSGTDPNGDRFDYLNGELRKLNADFIDEHYYRSPQWFLQNARRYDNYPRTGSKVFGGEYASHVDKTVGITRNTWLAALSEAAFMTSLERNADVVQMASYAPLFAHAEGWQWAPDLIWVNNLQSYGTPDYYVQKLFSLNKGSKVVPITLNNDVVAGQDSLYASACIDAATNELIIKLVNASDKPQNNTLLFDGVKKLAAKGKLTVMQAALTDVNSFDSPTNVVPVESTIAVKGKKIELNTTPYSFSVLRVKLE
ncbi:alpha-L-arabinofuranosidase [Niastella vici]|uniref:non-reducing end alpha-L-arabinofuranosidase n=1 Tax=Niastella vici TaxID=1703345 RepID=A0A1V9FWU9_9BACT|nr:alpha-L-arabinofuranosidase C-terminal domain-containing protein [Niastella vici]OQP62794.1 alpha-L-arabinofuranosidase [Niastella vici]